MQNNPFGKTNLIASRLGYGLWSTQNQKHPNFSAMEYAIDKAIDLGYNYFDTAWGYGFGTSEQIIGRIIKKHSSKDIILATKIPLRRPLAPNMKLEWVFSEDHIISFTEKSLKNLQIECIPLQQFHQWEDHWAMNDTWKNAIEKLKKTGKIKACGISINQNQPNNSLKTLETNLIDAVQVSYNIFDQAPEEKLFPLCKEKNIAIISRLTFNYGALAGIFTKETKAYNNNFSSSQLNNLEILEAVERVEELKKILPPNMTLAELALRFVLNNKDINVSIIGMTTSNEVEENYETALKEPLDINLIQELKKHVWNRTYNYTTKTSLLKSLIFDSKHIIQSFISNFK